MFLLKSCLITGAGSGLGKEFALLYSQKGYHVHLAGRNTDKLSAVQQEIEKAGGAATIHTIDLQQPEAIERLTASFRENGQNLSRLINNAGIGIFGPFSDMTLTDIETTFSTNVYGPILLTKACLPLMAEEGTVINIISTAGLRGKKYETIYCASKFALRGFTESLQKEYEESSVRFVAAYMGGMNTPFWEDSDYVKDPSGLPLPKEIAEQIVREAEDKLEIIIET
ncbi:oxidoreductase, short chain dehydrogenase/reductase family protein [Bacillus thermotolerans]|uniref:Oxidoreductase, short chain dehydrogenase/reductase family protein n=1 Tax=Bacillus thermotolerans TaxID=1221996 RepID=A0A0F5I4Y0_BACTR|nr:oxidoreductase, short chain dehydrogenase/reductase family protein [Bacillus thermotolerans]KKB40330.1 oxidoreductase, short chain dehydrogenase/reductase family protein [Bacillus thermotolerans]